MNNYNNKKNNIKPNNNKYMLYQQSFNKTMKVNENHLNNFEDIYSEKSSIRSKKTNNIIDYNHDDTPQFKYYNPTSNSNLEGNKNSPNLNRKKALKSPPNLFEPKDNEKITKPKNKILKAMFVLYTILFIGFVAWNTFIKDSITTNSKNSNQDNTKQIAISEAPTNSVINNPDITNTISVSVQPTQSIAPSISSVPTITTSISTAVSPTVNPTNKPTLSPTVPPQPKYPTKPSNIKLINIGPNHIQVTFPACKSDVEITAYFLRYDAVNKSTGITSYRNFTDTRILSLMIFDIVDYDPAMEYTFKIWCQDAKNRTSDTTTFKLPPYPQWNR